MSKQPLEPPAILTATSGPLITLTIKTREGKAGCSLIGPKTLGGVFFNEFAPGSAAAEAGVQSGDRLIEIDGVNVLLLSHAEVEAKMQGKDAVVVVVQRLGADQFAAMRQASREAKALPHSHIASFHISKRCRPIVLPLHETQSSHDGVNSSILNVSVSHIHGAELGFKYSRHLASDVSGIFVTSVYLPSASGLHVGDRILAINGHSTLYANESHLEILLKASRSFTCVVARSLLSDLVAHLGANKVHYALTLPPTHASDSLGALSSASKIVTVALGKHDFDVVDGPHGGALIECGSDNSSELQSGDRIVAIGTRGALLLNAAECNRVLAGASETAELSVLRIERKSEQKEAVQVPLYRASSSATIHATNGKIEKIVLSKGDDGRFGIALNKSHFSAAFFVRVDERYTAKDAERAPAVGDRILEVNGESVLFSDSDATTRFIQSAVGSTINLTVQRIGTAQFDQLLLAASPASRNSFKASIKQQSVKTAAANHQLDEFSAVPRTPIDDDPRSPGKKVLSFAFPETISEESTTDETNVVNMMASTLPRKKFGCVLRLEVSRVHKDSFGICLAASRSGRGIFINESMEESALQMGDLILKVNDIFVATMSDTHIIDLMKKAKDPVRITVLRFENNTRMSIDIQTGFKFRPRGELSHHQLTKKDKSLGVELVTEDGVDGVLVGHVLPHASQLKRDDRLIALNQTCLVGLSIDEVRSALANAPDTVSITVFRLAEHIAAVPRKSSLKQIEPLSAADQENIPIVKRVRRLC